MPRYRSRLPVRVVADYPPCINTHYKQTTAACANPEEVSKELVVAMSSTTCSRRTMSEPVISKQELE
ncbi:MAG: hypothetical protein JW704_05155 [Anaerolineaceae bacterium]|nr:hypothetical protein [Anaerolineaceae bacterium]MBN2677512.1 hypothetical protein [Anaerolineaceae bacterium]